MSEFKKNVLVGLGLLLAGSIYAGQPDHCLPAAPFWNQHTGFFAEGGLGMNGFYAFLPNNQSTGAFKGWGVGATVGYNIINTIGIEGGFIYSSDLNYAVETSAWNVNLSAAAAARLYIPYFSMRFSVPVGHKVNVIFKIGMMYPYGNINLDAQAAGIQASGRISGDHLMPFSGLGLTIAVTPQLDISLMYQGAVYVMGSGGLTSAGVTYHFG